MNRVDLAKGREDGLNSVHTFFVDWGSVYGGISNLISREIFPIKLLLMDEGRL
jgi:hypothetical protein